MTNEFGKIEVVEQPEQKNFPQPVASAVSLLSNFIGVKYKVISYVGQQVVKGVNYVFLVQQTMLTAKSERHVAIVTINHFDGVYGVVSIERII